LAFDSGAECADAFRAPQTVADERRALAKMSPLSDARSLEKKEIRDADARAIEKRVTRSDARSFETKEIATPTRVRPRHASL
jgi:hypothetical protein